MIFGSLFSGIGGIDLGLERAGMSCAWQVEIDDFCQRVLAKHWPNVPKYRDVREVGAHNLAPVDLIAGGFPCQDVAQGGRKLLFDRAAAMEKNAGHLLKHKPLENVVGLKDKQLELGGLEICDSGHCFT